MTFKSLYTSGQFEISKIQHLQKSVSKTILHIMPPKNYLKAMQNAKRAESTCVHKDSEKKRAGNDNPPSRRRKVPLPNSDTTVHPDSDLTIREAMGPVFKDTFARIDAMNGKEERRFLLVAETFLGPQRVLSLNKQFSVGEFNCGDYFTQGIQKLEANASKRGIDSFTLFNSKALISAKNMAAMKHINADVGDPDDWESVEESVQFLMESKSKRIRIDFKMMYKPTVEAQQEEDEEDEEDVEIIENRSPKEVSLSETNSNFSVVQRQTI